MINYTKTDIKNMQEIKSFLIKHNIEFKEINNTYVLYSDNPDKRTYEICYVPSHAFPISYPKYNIDGVRQDHFYKLSYEAEQNNSFKCWVKDYEWEDTRKREVLKSYWLYAGNKIKTRFYARDCEVREVKTKEGRAFESENCFYGKRGASLSLGLYLKKDKNGLLKDTLVMIYTFGLNFFGKDKSIEVLRVGTKKRMQVIGGASKLLKYFVNNYPTMKVGKNEVPVTKLKFYSDYDHNIGNSMDTLGFKFVSYSKGGFMNYWVKEQKVKGREPANHKKVMEQMSLGNVLAVPNAGVKTFVMNIDKDIVRIPDKSRDTSLDKW